MSNDDYNRVGPIVAERDDEDGPSAASSRPAPGRARPAKEKAEERSAGSRQERAPASGGQRALIVVLLVAVAGLAGYAVHLNSQATETRATLDNLRARFEHLEDQIMSTDESLSESGAAIQAKLREVDSEIRKLWGVSNDRNRKAIAANEEAIKGLAATVGKLEQTQSSQAGTLNTLRTKVDGFERTVSSSSAEVLAARAELEQIRQRLQTLGAAAERIDATANRVNNLDSKVRSHDEAIQSIDAFRRQTNQSLLQIRQQLGVQ